MATSTPSSAASTSSSTTNSSSSSASEENAVENNSNQQNEIINKNKQKDALRRVKLYHLSPEGKWMDKGTGHISTEHLKSKNSMCLVMSSEEDNSTPLESKVSKDDIYQLQGESLIVWSDPEAAIDMALSFQESEGCQQVWDEIRIIQGKRPDAKEIVARNQQEDKENEEVDDEAENEAADLPEPEISNLQKILDLFSTYPKPRIARAVLEPGYMNKLFEVFEACEDLEDIESCRILFQIFKTIVLLDNTKIFEILFSHENFMKLMGVLEYDAELPILKANHRGYLNNVVVFKEIIPFSNRSIVNKIHQTFRIQYLKDTVLPRMLDDQTFNTLNTLIYFNNMEIIKAIKDDETFLGKLFSMLKGEQSSEKRRDLLKFMQEYNNMLKTVQGNLKSVIYKSLVEHGLLKVLENTIVDNDESVRHCSTDIVCALITHDANLIREFILVEYREGTKTFLKNFIRGIIEETELGVQDNLTEALKSLVDPDSLIRNKDEMLNMFYSDFLDLLVSPINSKSHDSKEAKIHVLDLLSYFVQHHSYRSKNYILKNNVMSKAVQCIKTTEKDLVLAVIRFIRSCISLGDIFYNIYIIKNELFDPIVEKWRENCRRYNLINSAIIELFEYIRTNNVKKLITHVVEKYREDFEKITYVETFVSLIAAYDQEKNANGGAKESQSAKSSQMEDEENDEKYFSTEGTNEDKKKSQEGTAMKKTESHTTNLVDYNSDDEEERGPTETATEAPQLDLPSIKKAEEDDDDGIFSSKKTESSSATTTNSEPKKTITISLQSQPNGETSVKASTQEEENKKRPFSEQTNGDQDERDIKKRRLNGAEPSSATTVSQETK